jgi:hypothetical protein
MTAASAGDAKQTKANARKPWPDVPRLLQQRKKLGEVLGPTVASSVTAFLAWKAFLITAKSQGSGAERDRCRQRIADAIATSTECHLAADKFVAAREMSSAQSNMAVAEWFCLEDTDASARDGIIRRFRTGMRRLSDRAPDALLSADDRAFVAEYCVRLRNSVLAHGSVHSTGNLFEIVVPRFDALVCLVACQGYSERLGVTFPEARAECLDQHV